jgi:hypothetical protein
MKKYLMIVALLAIGFALPLSAAGGNSPAVASAGPPGVLPTTFNLRYDISLGGGGPDGYGYKWIDSDTSGGPVFDWVGITSFEGGSGTNTGLAGDDQVDTINMNPFSFSYYEGGFSVVHLGTNGWLSFTYDSAYAFPTNKPLPYARLTNGLFPLWDDMNLALGGSIWYWYDSANSRFIVEYYEVMHFGSGGPYTYEAILQADGTIIFQYLDVNAPGNSCTIGIQGGDGSGNYFLGYCYNGAPFDNIPHDDLAISFSYEKLEHDVKAVSITNPSTTVDPGSVINVEASVLNYGLNTESFDVGAEVESAGVMIYQSFQSVADLGAGDITTVTFPDPWFVPNGDGLSYLVTVYTMLVGDENPANDSTFVVSRAVSTEKLCIDDGVMANAHAHWLAGGAWGVKYTPADYPTVVESVWVYILSAGDPYYPWPDATHQPFGISIFDEAGGQPGNEVFTDTVQADDNPPSWVSAYPNVDINSGSFWVVNVQFADNPACEGMGVDAAVNYPSQNWARIGGVWQEFGASLAGDLMMCAFVKVRASHDVMTVSVDEPGPIVEAGGLVNPTGTFKNVGKNTESFDVACTIDSAGVTIYADTLPLSNLDPNNIEQIVFDTWHVGPRGTQYDVTMRTILAGDSRQGNDAKAVHSNSFQILYEIPSPYTANPPDIDGIIDFAEWSDSNLEDISDILAKFGGLNLPGSCMLYVKNDLDFVYFAIDAVFDETRTDWDNVWFAFDDNNDGAFPAPGNDGEGAIALYYTSLLDLAVYMPLYSDGSVGDMAGVNFAAATAMPIGHEQYEIAIPIGSLPEELNCSPTDTLGMTVGVSDTTAGSMEIGGWWVQNLEPDDWNNPRLYGKLILSMEVGAEEKHLPIVKAPAVSFLSQNSPNPFKDVTALRFGLANDCFVSIDVYDAAGRLVKNLVSGEMSRGVHSLTWDGTSQSNNNVPSGTYFLRMAGENTNFVKRMVMVK